MRILIITQWFEPEPALKGLLFARELKRRGHDVEVMTGFPNYPGGRLYSGYRMQPWQEEHIDGVRVIRVPLYPSHDHSGLRRAVNYLSFAASASTVGALLVSRPDVIYAYQPPATIALPAFVLRAIHGAPVVYDVQDMWPDTLASTGMLTRPWLLRGIGSVCRAIYGNADCVAVLSPGFRERLTATGVAPEKIELIYNWCRSEEDDGKADVTVPESSRATFNVLFAGNMGLAQGLDTVLTAAAKCAREAPNIHFQFVGDGIVRASLMQEAAAMNLNNVSFIPQQPASKMNAIFARADALLVHLRADPLFEITIPSKTQAYMAAGKPIVMAVRGDAADLVQSAGAGVVCPPEDPDALVDSIRLLAAMSKEEREEIGARGQAFYRDHLSLEAGASRFEALFAGLLERRRSFTLSKLSYNAAKRGMDITLSLLGLVLLAPVIAAVALAIRCRLGAPVLFRQSRPGLNAKTFVVLKFRTMSDAVDEDGRLLPDNERLGRFGTWLRRASLDELPQLWNVLRGDISLVGPRPLLTHYLSRYTPEQKRRHEVRPGITGWAQIHGRNTIAWSERLALDVWYVDHASLWLDVRILCATVLRVIRRSGISADGHATMPEFMGVRAGQADV